MFFRRGATEELGCSSAHHTCRHAQSSKRRQFLAQSKLPMATEGFVTSPRGSTLLLHVVPLDIHTWALQGKPLQNKDPTLHLRVYWMATIKPSLGGRHELSIFMKPFLFARSPAKCLIMSNYNLRLNYYQGAHLIHLSFNEFTLHFTLSNGYIWDYSLLINTQQLLHLHTLHNNDDTVERAARCILSKTTEYYGHYLLTTTHGSATHHYSSESGEGF